MAAKMQAVVKVEAGPGMCLESVPIPPVGPYDALVKIKATSICGTDLHIYNWDDWAESRLHPPLTIGHEFCGTVVEIGSAVTQVQLGDYVSGDSHVVCGRCYQCRTGRAHLCQNTQILGVDRDGCWAEYIALLAAGLWINPPALAPEFASLQDNFGNAVHTAFSTQMVNRRVLVTGCGPVGLMAIAVARAIGARLIFATDLSDYHLDLAKQMGADYVYNVTREDMYAAIMEKTDGEGVDVLLEMSGAAAAMDQGFSVLTYGGEVALLGLLPKPLLFDINNHIIFKGATVHGVIGRRLWDTWYEMRGLLTSGRVDLTPLVTHRFPLREFDQALRVMLSGHSGKVVMFPDEGYISS